MSTLNTIDWAALCRGCCRRRARSGTLRTVHLGTANVDYPNNYVSNTKYNAFTFLPKTLYEQFSAPLNMYFLLIAFLQLWRAITPVNPITTWAPLIFVVAVTAVKEAFDDLRRHRADIAANTRTYPVYRDGHLLPACASKDIRVGDLVVVADGMEVPCDLVLLRTEGPGAPGAALVETANLDGESDLKQRLAVDITQHLAAAAGGAAHHQPLSLAVGPTAGAAAGGATTSSTAGEAALAAALCGTVICDPPGTRNLYKFTAQMRLWRAPQAAAAAGAGAGSSSGSGGGGNRKALVAAAQQQRRCPACGAGPRHPSNRSVRDTCGVCGVTGSKEEGDDHDDINQHRRLADDRRGTGSGSGGGRRDSGGVPDAATAAGAEASTGVTITGLSDHHLVQHGTVVRKTGRLMGVAVYTGKDTRLNANKEAPPTKVATVDASINRFVIFIFIAQVALVVVYGVLGHLLSGNADTRLWYLYWNERVVHHDGHHDVINPLDLDDASWADYAHGPVASVNGGQSVGAGADPASAAAAAGIAGRFATSQHRLAGAGSSGDADADGGYDHHSYLHHQQQGATGALARAAADATVAAASHVARFAARGLRTAAAAAAGAGAPTGNDVVGGDGAATGNGDRLPPWSPTGPAPPGSSTTYPRAHLDVPVPQPWYTPLILPLRFLLLTSMMVPISLKITLDIIKLYYSRLIAGDASMALPLATSSSSAAAADDHDGGGDDSGQQQQARGRRASRDGSHHPRPRSASPDHHHDHALHEQGTQRQGHHNQQRGRGRDRIGRSSSGGGRSSSRSRSRGGGGADDSPVSMPVERDPLTYATAASSSICEELGHVTCVLTDKTGTLTENVMTLAAVSVGGVGMMLKTLAHEAAAAAGGAGSGAASDDAAASAAAGGSSAPPPPRPGAAMAALLARGDPAALQFASALALCNSVQPEHFDAVPMVPTGSPLAAAASADLPPAVAVPRARFLQFASASPDEEALALGAARMGVVLAARDLEEEGEGDVASASGGAEGAAGALSTPPAASGASVSGGGSRAHPRKRTTIVRLRYDPRKVGAASAAASGAGAAAAASAWSFPPSPSVAGGMPGGGDAGKIVTLADTWPEAAYEVLTLLPFTSDRKCMSVVLRRLRAGAGDNHDGGGTGTGSAPDGSTDSSAAVASASAPFTGIDSGDIIMITKGADEIVRQRLRLLPPPAGAGAAGADADAAVAAADAAEARLRAATEADIRSFSERGLRTLMVAARTIPLAEYRAWSARWEAAQSSLGDRSAALAAVSLQLERGLSLLGCTAIEDALQEGVPETVAAIRAAGVRIWMLTGDKAETAMQIATSARLVTGSLKHLVPAAALATTSSAGGGTGVLSPTAVAIPVASGGGPTTAAAGQQQQAAAAPFTTDHVVRYALPAALDPANTGNGSGTPTPSAGGGGGGASSSVSVVVVYTLRGTHEGDVASELAAIASHMDQQQQGATGKGSGKGKPGPLLVGGASKQQQASSASASAALSVAACGRATRRIFCQYCCGAPASAADDSDDDDNHGGVGVAAAGGEEEQGDAPLPSGALLQRQGPRASASGGWGIGPSVVCGCRSLATSDATGREGLHDHDDTDSEGDMAGEEDDDDAYLVQEEGEHHDDHHSHWRRHSRPDGVSDDEAAAAGGTHASGGSAASSGGAGADGRRRRQRIRESSGGGGSDHDGPAAAAAGSSTSTGAASGLITVVAAAADGGATGSGASKGGNHDAGRAGDEEEDDDDDASEEDASDRAHLIAHPERTGVATGSVLAAAPPPPPLATASSSSSSLPSPTGAAPPSPSAAASGGGAAVPVASLPVGQRVLVVDGIAPLWHVLSPLHSAAFLRAALACDAVICCRCLPAQKQAITALVKSAGVSCLAIGDGGNDVAMIQAAQVGVGISGREGKQAARAADFSVSRFRHLRPLLLVHGRRAHYRTALAAQFVFYKSMSVTIIQLMFNALCAFSGCSLFDTFALTTSNFHTFIPALLLVLDIDATRRDLLRRPGMYRDSSTGEWLSTSTFIAWVLRSIYHGGATFLIAYGAIGAGGGLGDGTSPDMSVLSYTVYTALVIAQFITLATEMRSPTVLNHGVNLGGVALYAVFFAMRDYLPYNSSSLGTLQAMVRSPGVPLALVLGVFVAMVPWMLPRLWPFQRPGSGYQRPGIRLAGVDPPPPSTAAGGGKRGAAASSSSSPAAASGSTAGSRLFWSGGCCGRCWNACAVGISKRVAAGAGGSRHHRAGSGGGDDGSDGVAGADGSGASATVTGSGSAGGVTQRGGAGVRRAASSGGGGGIRKGGEKVV